MIELFTADTPNGKKISIMLEEINFDYKVTKVNIYKDEQLEGAGMYKEMMFFCSFLLSLHTLTTLVILFLLPIIQYVKKGTIDLHQV